MMSRIRFKEVTKVKDTDYGIFFETKTPEGSYGQAYDRDKLQDIEHYVDFYYPLYVKDCEAIKQEA